MPLDMTLDAERRIVRATIGFPITFSDIRAHVETMRRTGYWVYPELVDARDIGRVDFSARDMLSLSHFVRERLGERPVAPCAVVVNSPRSFMLGRVFASLVAGWIRMGIFEDLAAAEDWLAAQREETTATPA